MSESFSAFREQYLRRHENPVNSALHTVADVVEVGGLIAGVFTRRLRVGVFAYTVAFAIGTLGHLFQPGTPARRFRSGLPPSDLGRPSRGSAHLCSSHLIGRPAGRARSTKAEQKWSDHP
jgi:hypothetical protein